MMNTLLEEQIETQTDQELSQRLDVVRRRLYTLFQDVTNKRLDVSSLARLSDVHQEVVSQVLSGQTTPADLPKLRAMIRGEVKNRMARAITDKFKAGSW